MLKNSTTLEPSIKKSPMRTMTFLNHLVLGSYLLKTIILCHYAFAVCRAFATHMAGRVFESQLQQTYRMQLSGHYY